MEEPTPEATLTLTLTVVVKPEIYITTEDKEAWAKQTILDQAAALGMQYDWGLSVIGSVSSTLTETATFEHVKPDYVEQ